MNEVCIIFLGATPRQNDWFWPTYHNCTPGINHDIVLVHRDFEGVTSDVNNPYGMLFFENKCNPDGTEKTDRAWSGYKYYFNKYKDKYKYFAFISDDVAIKRDNWLKDAIDMLNRHERLGFTTTMLGNSPPNINSPIWFARTECLKKIYPFWNFENDTEAESITPDLCVDAGYFGTQVGHEVTLAYDAGQTPSRNYEFESQISHPEHHLTKFTPEEIESIGQKYLYMLKNNQYEERLQNFYIPYNIVLEIQPFHGKIYNKSLPIVDELGLLYYTWAKRLISHKAFLRSILPKTTT